MKEVFRSRDGALIGFYQSILEDADIPHLVRNDPAQPAVIGNLIAAMLPLPDFWPALCVLNDDDYPEAMRLLNAVRDAAAAPPQDRKCPECGEMVPGNFSECWNCEAPLATGDSPACE